MRESLKSNILPQLQQQQQQQQQRIVFGKLSSIKKTLANVLVTRARVVKMAKIKRYASEPSDNFRING